MAEDVHSGLSEGGLNLQGALPLYSSSHPTFDFRDSNGGLWYDKFCNRWCMDPEKNGLECWSLESFDYRNSDNKKESVNPKMEWIDTVVREGINKKGVGNRFLLKEYCIRREVFLRKLCQKPLYFRTAGPFITGLGRNHPVENGFAWHHTLGVPYLPGSSVKGMVRSWAASWLLESENEVEKDDLDRIFGPRPTKQTAMELRGHSVGSVIFLDAIPIKPVQLKADIMTPHFGPYYQGNEHPADWHRPIPVPFLVVDSGQEFVFGLIPRRLVQAEDDEDCSKAKKWLIDALENIGAGAKTAVEYGRFEVFAPTPPKSRAAEWLDDEIERIAKAQKKDIPKVFVPLEIAPAWDKIEDVKLREEVLSEVKERYHEMFKHPTKGLKRAIKEIYEAGQSDEST